MLWGYAMPKHGEENWRVLWRKRGKTTIATEEAVLHTYDPGTVPRPSPNEIVVVNQLEMQEAAPAQIETDIEKADLDVSKDEGQEKTAVTTEDEPVKPLIQPAKAELYSELSIVLTFISILVALAISIIEFMGIALEKCASCAEAAENSDGLDGRWWRFWEACNDSSGYIGAGIVGVMLVCGAVFLGLRRHRRKQAERKTEAASVIENT